jgi:hypothetical protein
LESVEEAEDAEEEVEEEKASTTANKNVDDDENSSNNNVPVSIIFLTTFEEKATFTPLGSRHNLIIDYVIVMREMNVTKSTVQIESPNSWNGSVVGMLLLMMRGIFQVVDVNI